MAAVASFASIISITIEIISELTTIYAKKITDPTFSVLKGLAAKSPMILSKFLDYPVSLQY